MDLPEGSEQEEPHLTQPAVCAAFKSESRIKNICQITKSPAEPTKIPQGDNTDASADKTTAIRPVPARLLVLEPGAHLAAGHKSRLLIRLGILSPPPPPAAPSNVWIVPVTRSAVRK